MQVLVIYHYTLERPGEPDFMAAHDDIGFVIEALEYRENSLLVKFVTRGEGYISLVARGARSVKKGKTGGGTLLQPFNLVRVQFTLKEGNTLGNLSSVELESSWGSPRQSLEAYSLATWWFEILRHSSQARQDTSGVFSCTLDFLETQETGPGLTGSFLNQIAMLCHALGYGLDWKFCSICRRQTTEFALFSVKSGLICSGCALNGNQGLSLKPSEVTLVASMIDSSEPVEATAGLELLTLVNRYLVYHLESPLQSYEFVQKALR